MKRWWWCVCAVGLISAQTPRIGDIEFYGLHKVSKERILKVLELKPGDLLPPSKAKVEERLEKIPGVVLARLEGVCCEDGKITLFVGIEERGAPHFAYRSYPAGDVTLPEYISATYQNFLDAVQEAARKGDADEDLTQGYSMMADPEARAYQERFLVFARDHFDRLQNVLRNSENDQQRAIAATIIGYAPDKPKVAADLEYALQDPDESVRANAIRSLSAIAVLAHLQPSLGIKISPTWFVEMLNSIVLSDRLAAAKALVNLTEKDGQEVLDQIRERAFSSVLEMAQWKKLRYALPSYILAGRIGGLTEKQIEDSWTKGDRKVVIEAAKQHSKPAPQF